MKRWIVAATASGAVAGVVVWTACRPGRVGLDPRTLDYLRALALGLAAWVASSVGASLAIRRGLELLSVALFAAGALTIGGTARYADSAGPATVVTGAAWLAASGAIVLSVHVLLTDQAQRLPRRAKIGVGLVVLSGIAAALAGGGDGLGAAFGAIPSTASSPLARVMLGVHLAVLPIATIAGLRATTKDVSWRARLDASRRDPVAWAYGVWLGVTMAERLVHLLDLGVFRDLYRGTYRPWATVVAVHLPLVATTALLATAGWTMAVRPRFARHAGGLLVVDIGDPLETVRADLAAWLGDPLVRLEFADDGGNWIRPAESAASRSYDRSATAITRGGRPVGLIVHDVALAGAPHALATAATLAGLAIDANRYVAISEARLADTTRLSERLLAADTAMRSEVQAELQRGPLRRLQACAESVDSAEPLDAVVTGLRRATTELRELSHGLYPPELIEGGLNAVLPDRRGVPLRQLPEAVQITAYLLAVDDPESRFEDRGTMLCVHRSVPVSDPVLLDRIEVLGGSVAASSVELPVEAP